MSIRPDLPRIKVVQIMAESVRGALDDAGLTIKTSTGFAPPNRI